MSDAGLILGTRNQKKLAELRRILEASGVDVSVTDLSAYPDMPEVAETGATPENALNAGGAAYTQAYPSPKIPACVSRAERMPGCCPPGWPLKTDDQANLAACAGPARRCARDAGGALRPRRRWCCPGEHVTAGTVSGRIADAPRGTNGPAHPIFVPVSWS
jgi:XTP/dITP diphosphohydrolase